MIINLHSILCGLTRINAFTYDFSIRCNTQVDILYIYWNINIFQENYFWRKLRINVWAGIIAFYIIHPHVLPNKHDGTLHMQFLHDELPSLLTDVSLSTIRKLISLHDGTPTQCSTVVKCTTWTLDRSRRNNKLVGKGIKPWPNLLPYLEAVPVLLRWVAFVTYIKEGEWNRSKI